MNSRSPCKLCLLDFDHWNANVIVAVGREVPLSEVLKCHMTPLLHSLQYSELLILLRLSNRTAIHTACYSSWLKALYSWCGRHELSRNAGSRIETNKRLRFWIVDFLNYFLQRQQRECSERVYNSLVVRLIKTAHLLGSAWD